MCLLLRDSAILDMQSVYGPVLFLRSTTATTSWEPLCGTRSGAFSSGSKILKLQGV